jgi:hypothetical protein
MIGGALHDTYVVDNAGDVVQDENGVDHVLSAIDYVLGADVENLTLTGMTAINGAGNQYGNGMIGNHAANVLDGGAGADTMTGGLGDDTYVVDNASDWVGEYGGEGTDTVRTTVSLVLGENIENLSLAGDASIAGTDNSLDNVLIANAGDNQLTAGAGDDMLFGNTGADVLTDSSGSNLLVGGAGNDALEGGSGQDVVGFNRGDGRDTLLASGGTADVLSIGGGILYSELTLTQTGEDLVLGLGAGEEIVLNDWYAGIDNQGVARLQVIAGAMSDFNAGGTNPLLDHQVEQFDFAGLVGRFDQARAADPQLENWAMSGSLEEFHLGGGDSPALGGDAAYQYGLSGQVPAVGGTSTLEPTANVSGASATPSGSGSFAGSSSSPGFGGSSPSVGQSLQGSAASGDDIAEFNHRPDPSSPGKQNAPKADEPDAFVDQPAVAGLTSGRANPLSRWAGPVLDSNGAEDLAESFYGQGSQDDVMAGVSAVLSKWLDATASPGPEPLSDFEAAAQGRLRDEAASRSFATQWRRMHKTLADHLRLRDAAADSAWDSGLLQGMDIHGMSAVDENAGSAGKAGTGPARIGSPLPMFSGLQDGFERL